MLNDILDWNNLSMRLKAAYIRNAVSRGHRDIESIKLDYNEFKKGGHLERKQVFLNSLEESLKNNSRYNTPEWRKYLTDLAERESGYRANITNSIGAKGYFQLMPFNRAASWTTPTLLFDEMFKMSDANMKYFRKNLTKADLLKAEELGIDIYGLMAGAHLGGVKGVLRALRGTNNAKDMNGTSVMDYMKKFSLTNSRVPVDIPLMEYTPYVLNYSLNLTIPLNNSPSMDSNEVTAGIGTISLDVTPELKLQQPSVPIEYVEEEYDPFTILQSMLSSYTPSSVVLLKIPLTATEILALNLANRNTLLSRLFDDSLLRDNLLEVYDDENLFLEGGEKFKQRYLSNITYTNNRFPITKLLEVYPYFDPLFNPKEGNIEYMPADHDVLPYYNNYPKPNLLKGKSVVIYNDNLGSGENESVALDILSHGLRELDNIWKEKYLPELTKAYVEDANYFAKKELVPEEYKQEFIDSYVDGKVRAMLVRDDMRQLLNYPTKETLLNEYKYSSQLQQNALTEAYNYIFPILLPEVTIYSDKYKKSYGGPIHIFHFK